METVKLIYFLLVALPLGIIVLPFFILLGTGADTLDLWETVPATRIVLPAFGLAFGALGVWLLTGSIRQILVGNWSPYHLPHHLVIEGVHRHVRNPFSAGVSSILLAEALLTASPPLLCWFGFYTLVKSLTIPLVSEPILIRRFGDNYRTYMRNVPRWIPKLTRWEGDES